MAGFEVTMYGRFWVYPEESPKPVRLPTEEELTNYRQSLSVIGRLTAIDGATVVTRELDVLGFGAKITSTAAGISGESNDAQNDALVLERGPLLEDSQPERDEDACSKRKPISKSFEGTRHQSAARFVRDHHDAIAIVASQDGALSLITWEEKACISGSLCLTRHAEWELMYGYP